MKLTIVITTDDAHMKQHGFTSEEIKTETVSMVEEMQKEVPPGCTIAFTIEE